MTVTYDVIGMRSLVIHDSNLGGAAFSPAKDDAPLVVDPDRVKAGRVPAQDFEPVPRRHREVGESACAVHLHQLAQRDAGDHMERRFRSSRNNCPVSAKDWILIVWPLMNGRGRHRFAFWCDHRVLASFC